MATSEEKLFWLRPSQSPLDPFCRNFCHLGTKIIFFATGMSFRSIFEMVSVRKLATVHKTHILFSKNDTNYSPRCILMMLELIWMMLWFSHIVFNHFVLKRTSIRPHSDGLKVLPDISRMYLFTPPWESNGIHTIRMVFIPFVWY